MDQHCPRTERVAAVVVEADADLPAHGHVSAAPEDVLTVIVPFPPGEVVYPDAKVVEGPGVARVGVCRVFRKR